MQFKKKISDFLFCSEYKEVFLKIKEKNKFKSSNIEFFLNFFYEKQVDFTVSSSKYTTNV